MPLELPFVVRDPIHGLMAFTEFEREFIDTPIFQRLRGLKQSSLAHLTYPTALTTRFEHSLGTTHVAGLILAHLKRAYRTEFTGLVQEAGRLYKNKLPDSEWADVVVQAVRLAALFHDIGHLPFSHCFERDLELRLLDPETAKRWGESEAALWSERTRTTESAPKFHEFIGAMIVERHPAMLGVLDRDQALAPRRKTAHRIALDILDPQRSPEGASDLVTHALGKIIHGEIDADRLDFVRRDSGMAGSGLGSFDLTRLIQTIAITYDHGHYVVLPSIRGLSGVEAFLMARASIYRWQYHHHDVVYHDLLLQLLVRSLLRDGYNNLVASDLLERLSARSFLTFGDEQPATGWALLDDGLILSRFMDLRSSILRKYGPRPADEGHKRTLLMLDEILFRRGRRIALWKDHIGFLSFAAIVRSEACKQLSKDRRITEEEAARDALLTWSTDEALAQSIVDALKERRHDRLEQFQAWLWANGCPRIVLDIKSVRVFDRFQDGSNLSELQLLGRQGDDVPTLPLSKVSTVFSGFGNQDGMELRAFAYELLDGEDMFLDKRARLSRIRTAREQLAQAIVTWPESGLVASVPRR